MTRLTGQKLRFWSTGERSEDMFPYQQDTMIRPFWYRQFGTGDPEQMQPNDMYVSQSIQRTPPQDPNLGPQETDDTVTDNDFTDSGGYTTEDVIY